MLSTFPRTPHSTITRAPMAQPPVPSLAEMLAAMHVVSEYATAHGIELIFTDALTIDEHRRACRMRPPRGQHADTRPIALFGLERTVYVNTTWLGAATGTSALTSWRAALTAATCYLAATAPERRAMAIRLDTSLGVLPAGITIKHLPSAF